MRYKLKKNLIIVFAILLVMTLSLSACSGKDLYFVFGTTFRVVSDSGYGKLKDDMYAELQNMESRLSTQVVDSDIYKINQAKAGEAVAVGEDTAALIKLCKELYVKTNKAFNPAAYPLVELWQFSPDTYTGISSSFTIPTDSQIAEKLQLADFDKVVFDELNKSVTKLDDNLKIDLGGIAKGYAVGKLAELAAEKSAELLIDLGGNVYAVGSKSFTVGVSNPRQDTTSPYFAKLSAQNAAVSTSGDYERYYIRDDVRYCHIIGVDGKPASSGVISATVIGNLPAVCDALATAIVVLGADEGIKLVSEYGLSAVIILDNKTYKTVNCDKLNFVLVDTEYTLE